MWNTRPKMSYGEASSTHGMAGATPSRMPTWRQPSPGGGASGNPSFQQPQPQPQPQPDRREVEESMQFLSQYVSRQQQQQPQQLPQQDAGSALFQNSPGPWTNRSASASSTGPPPSRLAQPKTNPNLQQWMAAREGSVTGNSVQQPQQQQQREAAPHYASHNAPPPPPALSVPAGALSEPLQASATPLQSLRRGISSPQTIVQQNIAAQQMATMQQQQQQHQYQQQQQHQAYGSASRGAVPSSAFAMEASSPAPPAAAPPSHAFNHHVFNATTAASPPRPLFRAGDHDGNLVLIATYLKNHYGRESEETSRGIETMEPEDVLGLVQCFYIDSYRLIRTLREQSSAGRGTFGKQDPSLSAIKPIAEAHQPQPQPSSTQTVAPPPPPPPPAPSGVRSTSQPSQGHDYSQQQQQPPPTPPYQQQPPTPPYHQQPALQRLPTPEPQHQQHQPQSPFVASQQFPSYAAPAGEGPPPQQRSASQQQQQQQQQPQQLQQQQQQPQQQQQQQYHQPPPLQQQQVQSHRPQEHTPQYNGSGSESGVGSQRGPSQNSVQHQQLPPSRHARGPSNHRRELSLEQQLRDVPRRVAVTNVPLRVGMPQLRSGAMMLKYCRSGPPHLRYFSVQDRTSMHNGVETPLPHLTWAQSINGTSAGQLSLLHLEEVLIGPVGPNAQRFVKNALGVVVDHHKKPVNENLCFTLIFSDRTLELCALEEHEYEAWVGTLQSIVLRNRELVTASTGGGGGNGR